MSDFAGAVRRWSEKTERKMEKAVRQIALDVFTDTINPTPVKSGRARGNWQTSIGSPAGGVLDILDPTGSISIARAQGVVDGAKLGDVIYMVNNLPYIQRLENGWSQQAPSGMVGQAVQRAAPLAQRVIAAIAAEG